MQHAIARHGLDGLRATHVQDYRSHQEIPQSGMQEERGDPPLRAL